jgi:hypothetical protein
MGYALIVKLSRAQLQRKIRHIARDTSNVVVTVHARQQMRLRKVLAESMYECLRLGTLNREPEPNLMKGSLECRMEHYCAGRNLGVLVALCDEDPSLIVITVMHIGR